MGRYFSEHPETLWVAGRGDVIDENGKEIARFVTLYKNLLLKINNYHLLLIVNYLMQPSVFLSKKTYKRYGEFKGSNSIVMEYDMWLKMGKDKMPMLINSYLSSFRLISDNFSSTRFNQILKKDYKLAKKYTDNKAILLLHRFNNFGRKLLVAA